MFNPFFADDTNQINNLGAFNGPIHDSVIKDNLLYVGGQFGGVGAHLPSPMIALNYSGSGIEFVSNPVDFKTDNFCHNNGVGINDITKLNDGSYVLALAQYRSNNQFFVSDPKFGTPDGHAVDRMRYGHMVNITSSGMNTGWAIGMGGGKSVYQLLMLNERTGFMIGGGNNVSTFTPPNSTNNPGSRQVNKMVLTLDRTRNSMGYFLDQRDASITQFNHGRTVSNNLTQNGAFFLTGSIYPSGGTGIVFYGANFSATDGGRVLGGITAHEVISGLALTGLISCNSNVQMAVPDYQRQRIYFIGNFTSVNGITRNRAAACDFNFNLLPWNPNLENIAGPNMELGKSGIYISCAFGNLNPRGSGSRYTYLAKFDYENGDLISEFAPIGGGKYDTVGYGNNGCREFGDGKFLMHFAGPSIHNNNLNTSFNLTSDLQLSGRTRFGGPIVTDTISGKHVYGCFDFYNGGSGPNAQPNSRIKRIIDNILYYPNNQHVSSLNNKYFKERTNAACIDLNTNSITNWSPEIHDYNVGITTVSAMLLDTGSNAMFIGGRFDFINGVYRPSVGAVDSISGKRTLSFDANLGSDADRNVNCLEKSGDILYIGGNFQKTNSTTKAFVGIHTGTNALVDGFNWNMQKFPDPINTDYLSRAPYINAVAVSSMKRKDNLLYVGGNFSQVSGLSRSGLFCYDISKKQITDLNINFDDHVYGLDIDYNNNILYAVGRFHTVNGLPRPRGAAIDLSTSGITNWTPAFSRHANKVKVHPSGILVAGTFADLATGKAHTLTVFDFNTTQMQRYPRSSMMSDLYCMDIYSGKLYVGGAQWAQIDTFGVDRQCAAYELNNGRLYTGFLPNPSTTTQSMHIHQNSGILYIGGFFTNVRSDVPPSTTTATRNRIAAWDIKTNPHTFLTSFNPDLNGGCLALASSGNMLYIGGSFTTVGGITRNRLAAYNIETNSLDSSFNPNVGNNNVNFIKISGDHMYIGGDFTLVGGLTRNRCAKIRLSDGALDANFNPNLNGQVRSIDISGNYLYLGGNFNAVGATTKRKLCAVNPSNGTLYNNFTPIPAFDISTMYYSDPSSYLNAGYSANAYDYVEDVKVIPGTGVGFCGQHWELYQNSGNRGVHFVDATGGALLKTFGGYTDSVWAHEDNTGGSFSQGSAGEEFMVYENKLYVVSRQAKSHGWENMNRLMNKNAFLTITNKTNGDPICQKDFVLNTDTINFYGRGQGGETQWLRQYVNGVNYSGDNIFFYGEFIDMYPDERVSIGKMGLDGKLKNDFKLFSI
jgi:hypothetical protein